MGQWGSPGPGDFPVISVYWDQLAGARRWGWSWSHSSREGGVRLWYPVAPAPSVPAPLQGLPPGLPCAVGWSSRHWGSSQAVGCWQGSPTGRASSRCAQLCAHHGPLPTCARPGREQGSHPGNASLCQAPVSPRDVWQSCPCQGTTSPVPPRSHPDEFQVLRVGLPVFPLAEAPPA